MSSQRPERVLLVGRYFWPLGSIDSAGFMIELATALKATGMHVSVVTANHGKGWTEQFTFREFSVFRPVRMFSQGWTARTDRTPSRYIRNLRQWIEQQPLRYDLILCCGGGEEAIASVAAAKELKVPVIVRLLGHGRHSDVELWENSLTAARGRAFTMDADAVVVPSAEVHRRWLSKGGRDALTHRIPAGVGTTIDSSSVQVSKLRRAFAGINGDLLVPDACNVLLSVERMVKDDGVMILVDQAHGLSQRMSHLQYWLVGDGPRRESIFKRLRGDGLRQSCSLPGSFGCMDDVFVAADLLVHSGDAGFDHLIPTAVSASLPIVMANTETAREFFRVGKDQVQQQLDRRQNDGANAKTDPAEEERLPAQPWWFEPSRPKTLRRAIEQITANLEHANLHAARLRQQLQRQQPRSDSIEKMQQLIRRLLEASQ